MINVSKEFKNQMQYDTGFKENADITLSDGIVLELAEEDFEVSNNSVTDAASSNGLPLGMAIGRQIQIELTNYDDRFSKFDFFGAKIRLYLTYQLSETKERIEYGTFTVITPETYGTTIIITAQDDMYKADKEFKTGLAFPVTAKALLRDICSVIGIPLLTTDFLNGDFVINTPPDISYTYRQVIGFIAMLACGNARINTQGYLEIKTYDFSDIEIVIDGGSFTPWTGGENYDGGTFNPWTVGEILSGGTFNDLADYHVLYSFRNLKVGTDDVVITGISMENIDNDTFIYGNEGYVLAVDNPLLTGRETEGLKLIGDELIGATFRPFEGDHIGYPIAEFMDKAIVVDRKGNAYQTVLTDVNFNFFGFTTFKNSAESALRNSSKQLSESVKTFIKAKQLVEKEKTERELAVENLNKAISESSGMYSTEVKQEDGSYITYWHDKPTLEESKNVIVVTSEAIGFSTDGGKNYPYGLRINGEIITRLLYAEGINADYINTGSITITDDKGNLIFSADLESNQVVIAGECVKIGDVNAVQAVQNAYDSAKYYADEKISDFSDSLLKDIENIQAQVDGQIESYYYDYEPTMQNIPASEWTSTEEREKHVGDIFYWKSTGYSYRFLKDGATWKWQLVRDTDITKALAAAENAQDTADGKRRVFVVTPSSPYDIGDLWLDGTDLLTCTTARAGSNTFASADWAKLNTYTDDTVAKEALEIAKSATAISITLDNEYQGIPTDYLGNYTIFPSTKSKVTVYYGHADVSSDCAYNTENSSGVTSSFDKTTQTITVTGMTVDIGYVDVTASYLTFSVTKRFSMSKIRGGAKGDSGRTYFLELSSNVIKKYQNESFSPENVNCFAYYRDGNSASKTAVAGTFVMDISPDGSDWTTVKTSAGNTSNSYFYSSFLEDDTAFARITFQINGVALDVATITVLTDMDMLDQETVFNILTNNGVTQGVFLKDGKIFINGQYIEAGSVKAESINVDDLSALGATIGGWDINEYGISSETYDTGARCEVYLNRPTSTLLGQESIMQITNYIDENIDGEEVTTIEDAYVVNTDGSALFGGYVDFYGGYGEPSDERKKNIHKWENKYEEFIKNVPVICYDLKKDKAHKLQYGVSAQKTIELLNRLGIENTSIIYGDEKNGYSASYRNILMMALPVIQKQEKRIEELEKTVSFLKSIVTN